MSKSFDFGEGIKGMIEMTRGFITKCCIAKYYIEKCFIEKFVIKKCFFERCIHETGDTVAGNART
jgi:hypothetical protein